jgi:hypothetical protein
MGNNDFGMNSILGQINRQGADMFNAYNFNENRRKSHLAEKLVEAQEQRQQQEFEMDNAIKYAGSVSKVTNANTPEEADRLAKILGVQGFEWTGPTEARVLDQQGNTYIAPRKLIRDFSRMASQGKLEEGLQHFMQNGGTIVPKGQPGSLEEALMQAINNGNLERANSIKNLMVEVKGHRLNTPPNTFEAIIARTLNQEGASKQEILDAAAKLYSTRPPNTLEAVTARNISTPSQAIETAGQMEEEKTTKKKEAERQVERKKLFPKARNTLISAKRQWDIVTNSIDEAIELATPWTTGVGSWLSVIPATPQKTLKEKLKTIKANIGFDKLQDMRANSPTGGALGQVSEMENKLLQAVKGSLEQDLSVTELESNLMQIKEDLIALRTEKEKAFASDFADLLASTNERPPIEGARKAPDGKWYTEENGKFFRVEE